MSKYGKEDKYVTASDGKLVLIEMLEEYEKRLILQSEESDSSPENCHKYFWRFRKI